MNTLGAILAPVFGIMITDYYIIKKQLDVDDLFNDSLMVSITTMVVSMEKEC